MFFDEKVYMYKRRIQQYTYSRSLSSCCKMLRIASTCSFTNEKYLPVKVLVLGCEDLGSLQSKEFVVCC